MPPKNDAFDDLYDAVHELDHEFGDVYELMDADLLLDSIASFLVMVHPLPELTEPGPALSIVLKHFERAGLVTTEAADIADKLDDFVNGVHYETWSFSSNRLSDANSLRSRLLLILEGLVDDLRND